MMVSEKVVVMQMMLQLSEAQPLSFILLLTSIASISSSCL